MKGRPIIFSAPMVRALLDGLKTQTRRLATSPLRRCEVGDRLWVRENAWICPPRWTETPQNPMGPERQEVAYQADDRRGDTAEAAGAYGLKLRPSIHMPRWASRLTLIVEAVRVEPLQAISEADAVAEGIEFVTETASGKFYRNYRGGQCPLMAWGSYRSLWESLHGEENWSANPDVVALTFRVERGNIDRIAA